MATLNVSSGRLWATATLATLTIRTAWALGRAVHSAGLAGTPPWPNGRVPVATRDPYQRLLTAQRMGVSRLPLHVAYASQWSSAGLERDSGMP